MVIREQPYSLMTLTFMNVTDLLLKDTVHTVTLRDEDIPAYVDEMPDPTLDLDLTQHHGEHTGTADVYTFDNISGAEFVVYKSITGIPLFADLSVKYDEQLVNVGSYTLTD